MRARRPLARLISMHNLLPLLRLYSWLPTNGGVSETGYQSLLRSGPSGSAPVGRQSLLLCQCCFRVLCASFRGAHISCFDVLISSTNCPIVILDRGNRPVIGVRASPGMLPEMSAMRHVSESHRLQWSALTRIVLINIINKQKENCL